MELEDMQEALTEQAAKEGLTVQELVARILLQQAIDMIDATAQRRLRPAAVVLPFPGKSSPEQAP